MIYLGTIYGGHSIPEKRLNEKSIVYSFGLGEDASFDIELIKMFGCKVDIFDPTPRSAEFYYNNLSMNKQIFFHNYGLYSKNGFMNFFEPKDKNHISHSIDNLQNTKEFFIGEVKTLKAIMESLDNKKIDLLKMDIEGAEYTVLKNIIETKIKPSIICLEFHKKDNNKTIRELTSYGYTITFNLENQYTFELL